jgi:hypothetical protein
MHLGSANAVPLNGTKSSFRRVRSRQTTICHAYTHACVLSAIAAAKCCRAYDYEDSTKQQQLLHQPPTPQQGADAAALGRMGSLTPGASSQPQQQQQQQQQQGEDQLHDNTAADVDKAKDALADVPLAKRAKYLIAGPDAALQQQQQQLQQLQQQPMSPQQQAVQQLGLMEAAEAGVLRVKVARQCSSGSSSSIAGKSPAAAAAAAGSRQLPQEEAAAAGVKRKRQAGKVTAPVAATGAAPRQKRAAAAAASKAWGVAPPNFASASSSKVSGSSSSKASGSGSSKVKAAGGVKLVPKPADPTQLVPAPSKAELASGYGGSSYEVESILAHRVSSSNDLHRIH